MADGREGGGAEVAAIDCAWRAAIEAGLHANYLHMIENALRLSRVDRQLKDQAPERLSRVENAARRALQTDDNAWWWLRSFNRGLKATPLDLLITEESAARVERALGRLEHGIYG